MMEVDSENTEENIDGCIQSIHVRNFFCHENLEIDLNKNVNLIVGRNGSGKSAILTALVVGLGGRASATNRGSNLHSFIKNGSNSAMVEIKIKNSSNTAYKPDVYGDYITIVRNINASGGSSYKVKSASGEVKSTKFEEVNAIVLAHDIQVDNPISVLNQDDARSFHASDPKTKYTLYRKATNLDQTETNYKCAIENCAKANNIWKRKWEACIELEKEYKKWKASHEQMQSRDEIEAHKEALQNEYYWSEITEMEKEASTVQAQYEKQKARIDKLVEKLSKMEQHFGSNSSTLDKLKTELQDKRSEKTTLEQELRGLDSEVRELQTTWRSAQSTINKHNDLLNRERRKVADLEREIQSIDSGTAASRRAELESRVATARESAAAALARYNTAKNDVMQARANATHKQGEADQAAARAQRERDSIRQLKQQLRELESRGNDSLAVYGNNMVELVKRVKQAVTRGEFSAPPRGPVGSYLKVKEKKWGGALEHIIGGSLQSFCVNSPEDSRKLFEIMGQVYGSGGKPAVTCSKFLNKMHDVRRNKVKAPGFLCALDAVDVTDTVVGNFLIDNVGLESILLVPDHESAVRLADTVENVPENCSKIVTLDSSEYYPAPSYRSYGGANRPARYLHASTGERKRQVLSEIQELEAKLASLENQAEQLNASARAARESERESARQLQALMANKHDADEAVRAAEAALDTNHAPHHAVLVDELNISKDKLQTLKLQVEQFAAKEQQYKEKVDEYDVKMKEVKNKLHKATAACRNLSEEIDQEQLKLDQGVSEKMTCQQKLKEDKQKMAQVEAILEEKFSVIKTKIDEALTLCPRIDNPRDKSMVMSELKKTELKLSSIRSDGLTKAQVAERLLDVERKYRRNHATLRNLRTLIEDIKATSEKHLKICHRVQTDIARRVQISFQAMLSLRGYSGSMEIDNARGQLEIKCTGRESSAKRHAATTSSLSGGERSYSTVAFIMALWDCVELPFYFMDEFDVFMDDVNRKIVLRLLIDHATKNTTRQFVFLTPQDASVTAAPQISIHRMPDPRP